MRKLTYLFLFTVASAFSQADNVGSGHALQFDGVNDFVELGSVYHDLNLPFSISAWLYIDPSVNYPVPIFVTNDNNPTYRGFWFFISPDLMWCEIGDGNGGNSTLFRRGKQATVSDVLGKWINVSAVVRSPTDIDLYLNGINIGGGKRGDSDMTMVSSFVGDTPKIGYFLSNNVTYRYKGIMDEIRLWDIALTEVEVRSKMCSRLLGSESGLIGYWSFDELNGNIVIDNSINAFDGNLKGNPARVFSGAPIGDESVHYYSSNWVGIEVEMNSEAHEFRVENIRGNPKGVHLYKVMSSPSQRNGLETLVSDNPYYGIFIADTDNCTFDLNILNQEQTPCTVLSRADNSVSEWGEAITFNQTESGEYVYSGVSSNVKLGEDILACDTDNVSLIPEVESTETSLLWNTGDTSSTLKVTISGKYWVQTTNGCGTSADTISVSFIKSPQAFSLGEDKTLCNLVDEKLIPELPPSDFQFQWQDGSTRESFDVTDFGDFWLAISNECGVAYDTITYSKRVDTLGFIPNIITPNGDNFNESFRVGDVAGGVSLFVINRWGKEVYSSKSYQNDWYGEGLSSGVYFFTISGSCIQTSKGSVTILR
ncbi:MAG: gliding motility-associated C-terminal domain-containing protein [Cyclobacteriaceae bacterium]